MLLIIKLLSPFLFLRLAFFFAGFVIFSYFFFLSILGWLKKKVQETCPVHSFV